MYSTILLPTDGSEGAIEAVRAGLRLADRFAASVHALSVIDARFVHAEYDLVVETAEREAERALEQVERRGDADDVPVRKHLRRGIPHEEILDAIDAYGCDLVVVGTHGRTGIDRLVHLGSVTERVVRAAPVHVVTVPLGDADSTDETIR